MFKFFKKILLLFFCLLVIVVLLFFSLGNTVLDYFIQENLKSVNTDDFDVEVNSPTIEFFKLSIEGLTINKKFNFINIPLELSELDFEPNLFSVFSKEKKFRVYSNLYSGQVKADGGYVIEESKLSSKVVLNNAMLESHKIFKQFGVRGGKLSSDCETFEVINNKVTSAKCLVSLLNLNQPNNLIIPSSLSGLPLNVNIPAVKIKEVKFALDLNGKNILINDLSLVSDLVNIVGNLELNQGKMNLKIDLLERGIVEFGSLLRAFANAPKNANKFKVTATKHFRDLKINARM